MRKYSPEVLPTALLLLSGCLAPRSERETGSVEDLGRMLGEGNAAPVLGTVQEGPAEPLQEIDPDAAAAARMLEEIQERYTEPAEQEQDEGVSPYIRFGERIIVREADGVTLVTKPYTLPSGRPEKVRELIDALEPFPSRERATSGDLPPFDASLVEYQILKGFDTEYYTNFDEFEKGVVNTQTVDVSDVLVVTATPDLLEEFEEFLDLFAGGGVPQIELEAKIIEISETDSSDIGFQTSEFLFGDRNFITGLNVALPNFAESAEALLTLGAVQDGSTFTAILEAVKNWQNVSIESKPKTVVRSGGVASIQTTTLIPFFKVGGLNQAGNFNLTIEYQPVGTQLWISPRRVGSSTLALDVRLEGSQQTGSQVLLVPSGDKTLPIDVPVIATRNARSVVHLQPGQTLVIGGLTQTREQEIVRKVPILGDIPLLGFFFRSKFKVKDQQHVIFAISPRIIQRSDFESDL